MGKCLKMIVDLIELSFFLTFGCVQADLNGIDLEQDTGGIIIVQKGLSSTINFKYSNNTNPQITAILDTGTNFPVVVDENNKTGYIIINSRNFHDDSDAFGTYTLAIQITDWNHTCYITVQIEEAIQGMQIHINQIVPANEEILLNVTVEKGSNFKVEITLSRLNGTEVLRMNVSETVSSQPISLVLHESGEFILAVTALNSVNNSTENTKIQVLHKLNGLTVSGPSSCVHVTEIIKYTLKVNANAKMSMGVLKLEMAFGDGTSSDLFAGPMFDSFENGISFSCKYKTPGTYVAEMKIINNVDSKTYNFTTVAVTDDIPLPSSSDFTIEANAYNFPVYANISFNFFMNKQKPTPTNVTCTFYFGDDLNETITNANLQFRNSVIMHHIYTSGLSNYKVKVSCINGINSFTTDAIYLNSFWFSLSDFQFEYPSVIVKNMTNSTFVPETVLYRISLKGYVVMPTNVYIKWYFGDGSVSKLEVISTLKQHIFNKRAVFTVNVYIWWKASVYSWWNGRRKYLPINIGGMLFEVDKTNGKAKTDIFKYSASGILNGTYEFHCKPGEEVTLLGDRVTYQVTYESWGSYFPYVIGSNRTLTVIAFIPNRVYYDIYAGNLKVFVSNHTIDQPPGEVQIMISIPEGAASVGNVKCSIDMGDFINKTINTYIWNFTHANPIILRYTYLTLGKHNVWINCSNRISHISKNHIIESVNECFKVTGIFDRHYAMESTSMKVFTSDDFSLTNRMPVLCPYNSPIFEWTFCVKEESGNWRKINKSLSDPPTGIVRFARGEMSEGLYKITLKVSVSGSRNTYVVETTYIQFEHPSPFAYIVGGTQRVGKMNVQSIDGLTLSYDAARGLGANENLTFSWECQRYPSSDLLHLMTLYTNMYYSMFYSKHCGNLLQNATQGLTQLTATSEDYNGYALKVTVCIPSVRRQLCSSHTQLLQTVPGCPPNARIRCDINCKRKYAITSNMNVRAFCDDCTESELELLSYEWTLKDQWGELLTDFDETGTYEPSLVVKRNILDEGKLYYLSLKLSLPSRNANGESIIELITNYPPYGGTCKVEPESGNATTTSFNIRCSGWRDEGPRESRNNRVDLLANEPLIYEYISFTKQNLTTGTVIEVGMPLFKGGESTAREMLLPLGDKDFNYILKIMVRIYDYYGDYVEYNTSAQVLPDQTMIPKDSNDTQAYDSMIEVFDNSYHQINAGGNAVAVIQLIGSTASLLKVNLDENSTTSSQDYNEIDDDSTKTLIDQQKVNIVETFCEQILDLVPDPSSAGNDKFNAADVAQVTRSIETCIQDPNIVSDKTVENVVDTSSKLTDSFTSAVDNVEPFPIEIMNSLGDCADGIAGVFDKILTATIPDNLIDIDDNEEISEKIVESEVEKSMADIDTSEMTDSEIEKIRKRYTRDHRIKLENRLKKERNQKKLAKRNVPKMMTNIDKTLDAKSKLMILGQPEQIIAKDGIILSVENVRTDELKTKTRKGIKIDFESLPRGEGFEIGLAYFEKPPQMYGKGAARINSPSIRISTKDMKGKDISMPLSVKINNKGLVHYNKYRPTFNPKDPEKMIYFAFNIREDEDYTLIYVKPDSLDFKDYESFQRAFAKRDFTLYKIYVKDGSKPLHTDNVFTKTLTLRDWEHPFGFKSFIAKGLMKPGIVYVGLKPLEGKLAYFEKPPQMYGKGAARINSPSIRISTKDMKGKDISMPLSVKINNKGLVHYNKYRPTFNPKDPEKMIYFAFNIREDEDYTLIYVKPDSLDFKDYESFQRAFAKRDFTLYKIYVKDGSKPLHTDNVFTKTLTLRDWEHPFGFKSFIAKGLMKPGIVYVGLKPLEETKSTQRSRRSVETGMETSYKVASRKRRGAENDTFLNDISTDVSVDISTVVLTTGCRAWNNEEEAWVSNGCEVSPLSSMNETVCKCPKQSEGVSIFATTFYVPPNTIDFLTVFSKFDVSNASVYGTVLALVIVYFLFLIWARKQDRKDVERWTTHFLCDNDEADSYFYMITVHTGLRREAGTKSNINFNLIGVDEESGIRILSDGISKGCETGSIRKLIMSTKHSLGTLTYLHIWHDSSGSGSQKSWYLHKILVDDLQKNERFSFYCEQWLALDEGDGLTERGLTTSGKEDLTLFSRLFTGQARSNLTENHMLVSLFMRPEKSNFSRVHRLSCILAFLFLIMITSAMFYRSSSDEINPSEVQIGFLRFSIQTVYVSVVSLLITFPPPLLLALCFRYSRQKKDMNNTRARKNIGTKYKTDNTLHSTAIHDDIYINRGFNLPRWTLYAAWALVGVVILSSGFFLILYSMEWGKAKSEEWLSSFALSIVESLIVLDPLKVVCIAVIAALIFKSSEDECSQKVDIEKVRLSAKNCATSSQQYMALRAKVLLKKKPHPQSLNMTSMKQKLAMEMRARQVLVQLIFYAIYAFAVYSISYVNRDQKSFLLKNNVYNDLVTSNKYQFGFSKVHSDATFYHWMNSTFFQKYFPVVNYNGDPIGVIDKLFLGDFANLKVGPARLRQIRMNEEMCQYQDRNIMHKTCLMHYTEKQEDKNNYCLNWEKYNSSDCVLTTTPESYFTVDAWRYIPAKDIWGIPITGQYNTYEGGGYILNFEIDLINSQNIIIELKKHNWIDRRTRAVFLEFTLYNANANLFGYAIFLAEFTETGLVLPWIDIQIFRPYQTVGALGTYVLLCYFLYLIVLLTSTVKTIIQLKSFGISYFRSFWNTTDVICNILSYIAIAMWSLRLIYTQKAMSKYYDNKYVFINFQHVVVWDYSFNIIMGILVFVATIRILGILNYSKRMTQLAQVLSGAWSNLLGFGILLFILLTAYASLAYLLFGRSTYTSRSIFDSFGSLANTLIGKNSVQSLVEVSKTFALFYYITYVFVVIFIFISVFAAILNESISVVKAELTHENITYGVVDVVTDSLKSIMAFVFRKGPSIENSDTKMHETNRMKPGRNLDINPVNVVSLVRESFDSVDGFKDIFNVPDGPQSLRAENNVPASEDLIFESSRKYQMTTSADLKFDETSHYDTCKRYL